MVRILVVDDDREVANYLVNELQTAGWQTGVACDGVEAVLNVLEGDWDAVLMDVRMPKLDGLGALRLIRRLAPHLPVILFTGQANPGDLIESTRQGAFTCLPKPINSDKLLKIIRQALPRTA
jgi:two-component system response regulator AtoC